MSEQGTELAEEPTEFVINLVGDFFLSILTGGFSETLTEEEKGEQK